jgi:hypothetical protein
MSSGVANFGRIAFDDLQWEKRRYSAARSYAQSKLADLILARELARIAADRGWPLTSIAAHPGYTRTNLQTAGASLGRDKPKRSLLASGILPAQGVEQGTEPLLYAATSPDAEAAGYYGPNALFGLVGTTTAVATIKRARDAATNARLWAEAERLTGVRVADHVADRAA